MTTDQKHGADRRLDILLKARWGISFGAGARTYDRDMRRLASDGLVCIERVGGGGSKKSSRLVLTNEGRNHLLKLGHDPDIEKYVENPGPQYLAECDVIDGTKRRVLMKSGRQNVYLTRPKRTGETQQLIDGPIKYIVYGWNQNETVYHFYDQMADIIKKLLVPAGRLRETGRGLVLDPAFVLRIPSKNYYGEPDWDERQAMLGSMTDGIYYLYRSEGNFTLYAVCESETDLVLAKMIFPEGQEFEGFAN